MYGCVGIYRCMDVLDVCNVLEFTVVLDVWMCWMYVCVGIYRCVGCMDVLEFTDVLDVWICWMYGCVGCMDVLEVWVCWNLQMCWMCGCTFENYINTHCLFSTKTNWLILFKELFCA